MHSIYYMDTRNALAQGKFISVQHQLAIFKTYPLFDYEHARTEILKAINE